MRGKLSVYNIKRNQIGSPPQVRGKRYRRIYNIKSGNGSPPQVRGKPASRDKQGSGRRITPAGAGKTRCLHQPAAVSTDHPRRCGENSFLIYFSKPIAGSPPQVRGKHYPSKNRFPYYRITPAGAGKTYYRRMVQLRLQDHPRRCGENDIVTYSAVQALGSPPQVRGKLRTQP